VIVLSVGCHTVVCMPARSADRRRCASRVAGLARLDPADPRLPEARRDLRAAALDDQIRAALAADPPLTGVQRRKLATLLWVAS
jgi:hypothetical protein